MYKYILISDFDGTLCDSSCQISREIMEMLVSLGQKGIYRVIATGRSLYSAFQILPLEFPIDYLIFSSGAGLMNWKTKSIIFSASLAKEDTTFIANVLADHHIDFMIHHPVPENHFFDYFPFNPGNQDFLNRIHHYSSFALKSDINQYVFKEASQLLAVEPPGSDSYGELTQILNRFSVILATSPLDHQSKWIEIFPKHISKAQTAHYLCNLLHINPENSMAIGNDFNDLDLLDWAKHAYVVHNAHKEIKKHYQNVSAAHENGICEAVSHWLNQLHDISL